MNKQPWLTKNFVEVPFILLTPFICVFIIWLFPQYFRNDNFIPDAGWVILILLIDVGHVYSTLYRTYFDPEMMSNQKTMLYVIPFIGFFCGVLLYSIDVFIFWRALAYVAVFHFIRQQYGFMRLYSRAEENSIGSIIDSVIIYAATLYPLIYWHLKGPRNFNWFTDNDFFFLNKESLLPVFRFLYVTILIIYILKEIYYLFVNKSFNFPKFAIISGTVISWYLGIVYYNGDMAFTLLNVVTHGIPYMALIWIYGRKNYLLPGRKYLFLRTIFSKYGLVIFLGLIFLFAFVEEGLWDLTIWKEHKNVFFTGSLFDLKVNETMLKFLVPLLAVPQITHYIIDGFIWKVRNPNFKKMLNK